MELRADEPVLIGKTSFSNPSCIDGLDVDRQSTGRRGPGPRTRLE